MRKIKSFRVFETRHSPEVPAHFMPLHSIGYYLDPEEGMLYAMLKAGGYEDDPYPADEALDGDTETRDALSDKELEKVDSAYRDARGIIEPALDWDFISDIKDIALSEEILDRGYYLRIRAKLSSIEVNHLKGPIIYCEWYGHDKEEVWYPKLFQNAYREIKETDRLADSIVYELCVLRSNGPGRLMSVSMAIPDHVDMVKSMMSRIREMDPKMSSRLEYAWF